MEFHSPRAPRNGAEARVELRKPRSPAASVTRLQLGAVNRGGKNGIRLRLRLEMLECKFSKE